MGLDVYLKEVKPCLDFSRDTIWAIGITHNLTAMAEAAGLLGCWAVRMYVEARSNVYHPCVPDGLSA